MATTATTRICSRCKKAPAVYLVTMSLRGNTEALCGLCDYRYQNWCGMHGVKASKCYTVIPGVVDENATRTA